MKRNLDIILTCSGIYLIAVASMTVFGYVLEKPVLRDWNGVVGMALNTATCFIAVGLCLLVLGAVFHKRNNGNSGPTR